MICFLVNLRLNSYSPSNSREKVDKFDQVDPIDMLNYLKFSIAIFLLPSIKFDFCSESKALVMLLIKFLRQSLKESFQLSKAFEILKYSENLMM